MKKMTEENLKEAFAGESQAHMRYLIFAEKAESENLPNVARLFRANAFAERIHATNHLRVLSGVGTTEQNLKEAQEGEDFEVEEMYPAYMRVAQEQGEKKAETVTQWALKAEKVHSQLYEKAREQAKKHQDLESTPVHVCQVCGYTVEGEAPEKCPVCGSPKKKFKKF
ncbi:rubrerythrin family protein [bacterium]|nr:rubrerythrin family protein [bacterium]